MWTRFPVQLSVSKGILAAVKNALTGQEDTSEPACASGAAGGGASAGGTVTVSKIEEPAATGMERITELERGFGGTMKVCVVVSGGKLLRLILWKTAIRQAPFQCFLSDFDDYLNTEYECGYGLRRDIQLPRYY